MSSIKTYELKPPTIEAVQFTEDTLADILRWSDTFTFKMKMGVMPAIFIPAPPSAELPAGVAREDFVEDVHFGDYIVKKPDGTFEVWDEEDMAQYREVENG